MRRVSDAVGHGGTSGFKRPNDNVKFKTTSDVKFKKNVSNSVKNNVSANNVSSNSVSKNSVSSNNISSENIDNIDNGEFVTLKRTARARTVIKGAELDTENSFSALNSMDANVDDVVDNVNDSEGVDGSVVAPATDQPTQVRPEPLFLKTCDNWKAVVAEINDLVREEVSKKISDELINVFQFS